MSKKQDVKREKRSITRRQLLKGTAAGAATMAIPVGTSDASVWQAFFSEALSGAQQR